MTPPRLTPTLLATALALAGCGISNPYQSTTRTTTSAANTASRARTPAAAASTATAPPDAGDPVPERGGTIPRRAQATENKLLGGAARPTPEAALKRYATTYLNWNATHVIAIQHQLAAISLGQARAQAQQAAVSAARDPQLTTSQVANRGQVIAIAPGQADATGQWVIVTNEQTTGHGDYQDLPATLHIIYAQLTNTRQGWVISGWQPQN